MELLIIFALALAFLFVQPSTCFDVKGVVSCLDCTHDSNLSGIRVLIKCDQVKKLVVSVTENDGSFTATLPSSDDITNSLPNQPLNCLAKLLGGQNQLYTKRNQMVSKIVKSNEDKNSYTIVSPLAFSTTCPLAEKSGKCSAKSTQVGSSKTIDFPLPREWGLAPSSYYLPFLPIIGIP